MNKSIYNILGITILIIIVLAAVLSFTETIPGKAGDILITSSAIIAGIFMYFIIRKKKKDHRVP